MFAFCGYRREWVWYRLQNHQNQYKAQKSTFHHSSLENKHIYAHVSEQSENQTPSEEIATPGTVPRPLSYREKPIRFWVTAKALLAVRDGVSFAPPINSTISQKSDRLILWAVVQDMDVDNDLGDVAESEKADSPKRSAKKIPLVV